jgi:hypothetical protein
MTFNRIFRTKGDDTASGIKMQVCNPPMANQATNGASLDKCIDMNRFHEILGHCGAVRLQKTAHIHGIELKGNLEVCEACAIAKARQKNVNKEWKGGRQTPGERLYMDISSVRDLDLGGSRFWLLVVDECVNHYWSIFLKAKSELKSKMMTLVTDLKIAGVNVKFIRCDDSGGIRRFILNVS